MIRFNSMSIVIDFYNKTLIHNGPTLLRVLRGVMSMLYPFLPIDALPFLAYRLLRFAFN